MSNRSAYAYGVLARRLKELRRHDFLDLLVPLVGAADAVRSLERLVGVAGNPDDARRLKVEALRARASYERSLHHVVEMISDMSDGFDLVDELTGGDELLADVLLGGD